jgi:hypothetical protein
MDPKEVKKAIHATVIASRVYKVLSSEQLDALKKVSQWQQHDNISKRITMLIVLYNLFSVLGAR